MNEFISMYFAPILAIWGLFYIFVLWVLWMIVKSLKGIDASLKEIAADSHAPKS
jgi:glucan phosphoethanolaminetransferase (alkaline phosphatase superfamily)